MGLKDTLREIDLGHVTVLGAAMAGLVVFLFNPVVFNDGDTFWHIATGDWILAHHAVPRVDPFSFTAAGRPWQAHEWLSELLMALAYKAGGWTGIGLLFGAVGALTGYLVARATGRSLGGLALIVSVALGLAVTNQSLLARPHILALPLIVGWTWIMIAARDRERAPPLGAALLLIVWANLHASYALAFVIAGAFGLEALLAAPADRRWRVLRDWALFAAAAVACVCLTPFGVSGLVFPFQLMSMTTLFTIEEWLPVSFAQPGLIEAAVLIAIFALVASGARMRPLRLMLLLLLLHMALQHVRQLAVLGVVAPLLMAEPLAKALKSPPRPAAHDWRAPAAAFAVLAAMLIGSRLLHPLQRQDSAVAPIAAIDHLDPAIRAQPVLNDYAVGGYLIFRGVRPYIDGRADMYGDRFMGDYMALIRAPAAGPLNQALEARHIAWTLFPPGSAMAEAMDRTPGWRREYSDRWAIIHVRGEFEAKTFGDGSVASSSLSRDR